jgi:hypothetical protein
MDFEIFSHNNITHIYISYYTVPLQRTDTHLVSHKAHKIVKLKQGKRDRL